MTGKRLWIAAAVTAAVVFVAMAWLSWPGTSDGDPADAVDPDNAELVALGEQIYGRECAACHGSNREGQANWRSRGPDGLLPAPPLDGSAHSWHHPDRQLFDIVKNGPAAYGPPGYRSAMPAFGDKLSDREIAAVLSFVESRWPARARAMQAEITRRAREGGR